MDLRNKITFEMPLEFKITRPVECPYLNFKMEQRLAADISGRPDTHDTLAKAGFRRVENWVYKPACGSCQSCVPVRIPSGNGQDGALAISRNQRRVIKRNNDVDRTIISNISTLEHYDLFTKYLNNRHDDGQMVDMDYDSHINHLTVIMAIV